MRDQPNTPDPNVPIAIFRLAGEGVEGATLLTVGGPWATIHCARCNTIHDFIEDISESLGLLAVTAFQCKACGVWNGVPKSAEVSLR